MISAVGAAKSGWSCLPAALTDRACNKKNSDDVCSRLSQHTLTILARTSKEIKNKVQNALYYHASVRGYRQLVLFIRTIDEALQFNSRGIPFSKNVHDLKLVLDLDKEEHGDLGTAAVLGQQMSVVAR